MSGLSWTEQEVGFLDRYYPYMLTEKLMYLLPDRTYRAILTKAARLGLYKQPEAKRLCDIDDHFFSEPSPFSAYWAGFLAADGCINEHGVYLGIHARDLKHLEKFRDAVAPDKTIRLSNNRVSLALRSLQICEDLAYIYGIVPRKSLILPAPSINDEDCVIGYIAGLLDGDGSVLDRRLQFLGTRPLMNWVKSWFDFWDPRPGAARVREKSSIYKYTVGIGRAAFFVQRARELCLPVLERKWSKMRGLVEPRDRRNAVAARPRQARALALRKDGLSYRAIADYLGYSHGCSARSAVLRARELQLCV